MAITQVGSAMTGSSASSGSFSITKPTGVQDGDLLIMIGASNEGAWNTFPSGWTQLAVSTDATTPNAFRAYMWYKVASSEGASYNFGSTTASGSGAPMVGLMVAYRGVDTSSPFPNVSTDHLGALAAGSGNPAVSFTQTLQGRQFFARFSRSVVGSPDYSTATSGWAINGEIAQNSGGSTTYALCWVPRDADDGAGSRNEPSVPSGVDTTDNFYILGLIEAIPMGTAAATTPAVTSQYDGYHRIDATLAMTTPMVTTSMDGIAAPPSGPMAMTTPSVTSSLAGTSIGGAFAGTTPSTIAAVTGGVEPLGAVAMTTPMVTAQIQAETRAFGEHVIVVEPEERAFRVTDEGNGLIPIKRSQVTNL